jgi:hypothetical protein
VVAFSGGKPVTTPAFARACFSGECPNSQRLRKHLVLIPRSRESRPPGAPGRGGIRFLPIGYRLDGEAQSMRENSLLIRVE